MIKKKKRLKKKYVRILWILLVLVIALIFLKWVVLPKESKGSENPVEKVEQGNVYHKDSKGKQDYVLMKTGHENQMKIGAFQGCEVVSLYNALVHLKATQGKSVEEFVDALPLLPWGSDPDLGYAGDPWTPDEEVPDGGFPTIWPRALVQFAKQYAPGTRDISGASIEQMEKELLDGQVIEMWVTIDLAAPEVTYTDYYGHLVVTNTHAILLDGFDAKKQQFHVTDPIDGKHWVDVETIDSVYHATNEFAIVVAD